ncbi:MAG TPA: hypothetical protein VHE81_13205 [Lacipirellulaceae bacterium]|nr:hypothetical protein [Lacipirellulaceae bacterium]
MSQAQWHNELRIPGALALQMRGFRRRVWSIKLVEAICFAALSMLVAFLLVFALDRLFDTPAWLRLAIELAAIAGCCALPWFVHRWVWRFYRLDQLARLLSYKMPRIGDQLLGIIELAENRWEQHRSRALCQAAIEQVSDDAQHCDFRAATPDSRLGLSLACAAALLLIVALLAILVPAAAGNAFARLARPWSGTPRYTFAALEPLPNELVVAHGEAFPISAKLTQSSLWHPSHATARLASQQPITADLAHGGYHFTFPAQIESGNLRLRVGDATFNIDIQPKLRPELTKITAKVRLPDYLGHPGIEECDVRGGTVALVKGSRVSFAPTVNRPLHSAQANGNACTPIGESFTTPEILVKDAQQIELQWQDNYRLSAKEPFKIAIAAQDDEPPQLSCEDLPRGRVVLDT